MLIDGVSRCVYLFWLCSNLYLNDVEMMFVCCVYCGYKLAGFPKNSGNLLFARAKIKKNPFIRGVHIRALVVLVNKIPQEPL